MKNIIITSLLLLVASCGQNSGLAPEAASTDPFAGITCDLKINSAMTKAEFEAVLQSGPSSSNPYTICILSGVTINSPGTDSISVSVTNLKIVGASNSTSILYNVSVNAAGSSNSITFKNVKLMGLSGAMGSGALSVAGGISVNLTGATLSASSNIGVYTIGHYAGNLTVDSTSIQSSADPGQTAGGCLNSASGTATISGTSCVSAGNSFNTFTNGSGDITLSVSASTITTGSNAINAFTNLGGNIAINLADNTYKSSGTGMGGGAAINAFTNIAGSISVNDTSSGVKDLACNIAGSAITFNAVYTPTINIGGSIGGTYNANNTRNGSNNSIGTCP